MFRFWLFIAASVVIAGRFLIEPRLELPTAEGSYEAFAHLFVGGLFGYWFARRKTTAEKVDDRGATCLFVAISISLFELGMFVLQKIGAIS